MIHTLLVSDPSIVTVDTRYVPVKSLRTDANDEKRQYAE